MAQETEKTSSQIVGPLNFVKSTENGENTPNSSLSRPSIEIQCLFCDKIYKFYTDKDEYLAHLYLNHRLIIGDEEQVAIFHEYLIYWREKFAGDEENLPNYCTTMLLNQLPDGTPSKDEKYFLLCDVLPQDNELRSQLHKKHLEQALAQHQFERIDTNFERNCLFCRDVVKSTRSEYLEHLFSKHFLQLGKPENLVYIDELIDMVQHKLNDLICLFCEKTFRDRPTLKEHMRKKGHKRINPNDKSYDRFFLINYRNNKSNTHPKRSKHQIQQHKQKLEKKLQSKSAELQNDESSTSRVNEHSTVFESDSDSNWSDWEGDKQEFICLYCPRNEVDFMKLKEHIKNEHFVDFDKEVLDLTFYDQVKIVNFIRRKIYLLQCVSCDEKFSSSGDLQNHLNAMQHHGIGNRKQWDRPEYFFPTYEDDAFLCSLDDANGTDLNACQTVVSSENSSIVVLSEDTTVSINLDAEALSKEQMLDI